MSEVFAGGCWAQSAIPAKRIRVDPAAILLLFKRHLDEFLVYYICRNLHLCVPGVKIRAMGDLDTCEAGCDGGVGLVDALMERY